jgi:hypothetical protein
MNWNLRRAVVKEVVTDTTNLELYQNATGSLRNSTYVPQSPRNSIVAKIITDGLDISQSGYDILAFPFFPPHLSMPAKTGEQIWIISEKAGDNIGEPEIYYWMCRVPEANQVDDINYTHADRKFIIFENQDIVENSTSTIQKTESQSQQEAYSQPEFPNGNGESPNINVDYSILREESESFKDVTLEAVPRFNKRPGDFVLQGSNNTLICLGEDRGWVESPTPGNTSNVIKSQEQRETGFNGTIDIVAGRGFPVSEESNTINSATVVKDGVETSPSIVLNTSGTIETNKNPFDGQSSNNSVEGDPNFVTDLSRVYISMKTKADTNFGIQVPGFEVENETAEPAVVIKTDHARIVARQDLKIMIGDPDTGSAVVLKADGNIVFVPGPEGVIKLGGDDADKAIVAATVENSGAANAGGTVSATGITTTMGGVIGVEDAGFPGTGVFATKVLVK